MCTSQDLYGWTINGIELPFLLQLEMDFKVLCAVKIFSFCQKCIIYLRLLGLAFWEQENLAVTLSEWQLNRGGRWSWQS